MYVFLCFDIRLLNDISNLYSHITACHSNFNSGRGGGRLECASVFFFHLDDGSGLGGAVREKPGGWGEDGQGALRV